MISRKAIPAWNAGRTVLHGLEHRFLGGSNDGANSDDDVSGHSKRKKTSVWMRFWHDFTFADLSISRMKSGLCLNVSAFVIAVVCPSRHALERGRGI